MSHRRVPTSILPEEGRALVVEAAAEVLRRKDPPEVPTWLRKLRDFDPRRLRSGRAAEELLRGVDHVEAFGDAVAEVLARTNAYLKSRLEGGGAAAVEEWVSEGGGAGKLAAVSLTLEPWLGGYVAGRASALAESAAAQAAVEAAQRAAAAAEREATARVERAQETTEGAAAARDEAVRRLDEAQGEVRRLRAAAGDRQRALEQAERAMAAERDAKQRLDAATAEIEAQGVVRRDLERRLAALERERDDLRRRLAEAEGETEAARAAAPDPAWERAVEAAARVASALEAAASVLREALSAGSTARGASHGRSRDRGPSAPTGSGPRALGVTRTSRRRGGRATASRRPELALGMDPDSPEGLSAMLRPGVMFFIDGYNAVLDDEGMVDRHSLVAALNGWARGSGAVVRVYFDGEEAGSRRDGEVDVIFTAAHDEADDVILADLESQSPGRPAVVVSSDRRVRSGAEALGAAGVSSRTLLRAVRSRRA